MTTAPKKSEFNMTVREAADELRRQFARGERPSAILLKKVIGDPMQGVSIPQRPFSIRDLGQNALVPAN